MESESYIVKSGQLWKLWVFGGLLVVGFTGFGFAFAPSNRNSEARAVMSFLLGITFSIIAFLWGTLSVKCRACGNRLVWQSMRNEPAHNWLNSVLQSRQCPKCKHQILTP